MAISKRCMIYQICRYLSQLRSLSVEIDEKEQLDVAMECLSSAFQLKLDEESKYFDYGNEEGQFEQIVKAGIESLHLKTVYEKECADVLENEKFPAFLKSVTDKGFFKDIEEGSKEYYERYNKVVAKFRAAMAPPRDEVKEDDPDKALEWKEKGNAKMKDGAYKEAIDCYTTAISLSRAGPASALFYCNRAAAKCHLSQFKEAVEDCQEAIKLDPKYAKAYSRLGYAYYYLGDYESAMENYRRALNIDPNNITAKEYLALAEKRLKETGQASTPAGRPGAGGAPDLSSILGGANAGGAGGGNPLSSLLQNPAMMQMAQQFMQDGGMQNMMSNPAMMQMAQQVMQNPDMLNSILGSAGQGRAAGGDTSTSSTPSYATSEPSSSSPSTSTSSASPSSPNLSNLMDPSTLQKIMSSPKSDPDVAPFLADLKSGGMTEAMKHLSNPNLMAKLKELISDAGVNL